MRRIGGQLNGRMAAALIALALFVRLLVPSGWMPAEGRPFTLAPCPAAAPLPTPMARHAHGMAAGHGDHAGHQRSDQAHDQPCAFAPFAAALTAPDPLPPIVAPLPLRIVPTVAAGLVAVGRGLAAPPPPPTGPPATL